MRQAATPPAFQTKKVDVQDKRRAALVFRFGGLAGISAVYRGGGGSNFRALDVDGLEGVWNFRPGGLEGPRIFHVGGLLGGGGRQLWASTVLGFVEFSAWEVWNVKLCPLSSKLNDNV